MPLCIPKKLSGTVGKNGVVTDVYPLMELEVTVMLATPNPMLVTRPDCVVLATVGSEELQNTEFVASRVLPSTYVPVAVYWYFPLSCSVRVDGETDNDTNPGDPIVNVVAPVIPPDPEAM